MIPKRIVVGCLTLGVLLNLAQLSYTYVLEGYSVNLYSPSVQKSVALHILYGLGLGTGFCLVFAVYNRRLDRARRERERLEREKREALEHANTELRKFQAQLVQAEKLSAIGRLAAGVAHELNNPLQAITTYAHLLQKRAARDPQTVQYSTTLQQAAQRCERIVKGLLAFSRQPGSEKVELSAREVVDKALMLVLPEMKSKNIRVAVTGEDATVHGDSIALQQVVTNLLLNSRDAIGTGGSIDVSLDRVDGFARISVHDSGSGIPADVLPHLFEPFFTTKPPGQGTGLGLSVSYGIVKDHNGSIVVESQVGRGTTFRVLLPAVNH